MSRNRVTNDWRADQKPGVWRAPSSEALALAPSSIQHAVAEYQRIEQHRQRAGGDVAAAERALAGARDRLISESTNAIIQGLPAPEDPTDELERTLEAAKVQASASNIAAYQARQTLRDTLAADGDEWRANAGELTGSACVELLALADEVEARLPDAALMFAVSSFISGAERDKLVFNDNRAVEAPIFDRGGFVTGRLKASDVLADLRALVRAVEEALQPPTEDEDGEPADVDLAEFDAVELDLIELDPGDSEMEPVARYEGRQVRLSSGIEVRDD